MEKNLDPYPEKEAIQEFLRFVEIQMITHLRSKNIPLVRLLIRQLICIAANRMQTSYRIANVQLENF